jgi:hypothetical protein
MNANRLLAMCMKETTMSETLNGKPGRWVRATKELRAAMLTGDTLRLSREQTPFSVSTPGWRGWDALDYDVWIPDPVPTVLDRVKEFEKQSPSIFERNVGRTTAAVYRACERVVRGQDVVYVVAQRGMVDEVADKAARFFKEEFVSIFSRNYQNNEFTITQADGRVNHLTIVICTDSVGVNNLPFSRDAAIANDYGEWAAHVLRHLEHKAAGHGAQNAELLAHIKSVEAQYDIQEKEALNFRDQLRAIEGDRAELRASLQASENGRRKAEKERREALEQLSTLRRAIRALGVEPEATYATYARVAVAKDQSSIGVQAACSCEDAGDVLP